MKNDHNQTFYEKKKTCVYLSFTIVDLSRLSWVKECEFSDEHSKPMSPMVLIILYDQSRSWNNRGNHKILVLI